MNFETYLFTLPATVTYQYLSIKSSHYERCILKEIFTDLVFRFLESEPFLITKNVNFVPLFSSLLSRLNFLLISRCSLLCASCSLIFARCSLLSARCSLLSARCSLVFACCSLLFARC